MNKTFPLHGIFGIILLVFSEILHFKKIDPFYSWFYCFAWWSYILIVDAIIFRLKENSLLLNRTKEFFLMVPWSVFIWLIFEAANLSLENWYYINLPHSIVERWLGYAVAYGTVLPGLFETTELLESFGLFKKSTHSTPRSEVRGMLRVDTERRFLPRFKNRGLAPSNVSKIEKTSISSEGQMVLILLGTICLVSSVLLPEYLFPFIWVGFIFLLEPFNYRFGGRSLLKDLEEGNLRKIYLLLIAGLICGFLWEFWNFWARSKWVYTVPYFEKMRGFEMPFPGFLGFPPFAIQAYVMYNFISLFRFGRGWEESTYRFQLGGKKTRPLTVVLAGILLGSFFILIFRAIDLKTVDSYYPRLKDAYWIELRHRKELPKVGITTLNDLLSKTKDKTERDELALRLLIPKEELIHWVEKAHLVQLKGLGIENLRLLEGVGVHSVTVLATEDPERLYKKMEEVYQGRPIPKRAKIHIWIKEAQKPPLAPP